MGGVKVLNELYGSVVKWHNRRLISDYHKFDSCWSYQNSCIMKIMKPTFLERLDFFPTPVWRYEFPDFYSKQEVLTRYLARDEMFFTEREQNGLQVTDGNLHDKTIHPDLAEITDFFTLCFEDVMVRMGFEKDIGLTTMWATRQKQGGFHHEHIHANTFLAGVLYLYDIDGNAHGTVFKNNNAGLHQIVPRANRALPQVLKHQEVMPFVPGTAIIFPGWALHQAVPTNSRYRMIVGANCMPIGRTNSDHYNQYVFPNPQDFGFLPLEEHIKSGYGKQIYTPVVPIGRTADSKSVSWEFESLLVCQFSMESLCKS